MPGLDREVQALKPREDWTLDKKDAPPEAAKPPAPTAFEHYLSPLYDAQLLGTLPYQPPSPQKIHQALRTAGESIPRYLFRAWGSHSGGSARLNSVHAITPLAFLDNPNPPINMFDLDATKVRELIIGHLDGMQVKTLFSSWSHSLPFVMSIASEYISVIDTRQLKPENFIFHCGASALGEAKIVQYDEEFLVFGVVEGKAHSAVPMWKIAKYKRAFIGKYGCEGYDTEDRELLSESESEEETGAKGQQLKRKEKKNSKFGPVKHAISFGAVFGVQFALPMAISFLSIRKHVVKDADWRDLLLTECKIPDAWIADPVFPLMPRENAGFAQEVLAASTAMKTLVEKLQAADRIPKPAKEDNDQDADKSMSDVDGESSEDMEMDDVQGEPSAEGSVDKGGPKHLKKPARMPRELYQLYIDMVGFDEHNDAVRQ